MRIRRLRLTGFKSFVDPAELRIEPGLTGVVGPNGCGKSNLLEAIRWAMGEASPTSLRGGGMEDVIFAGTATRPARDFAEVSMLVEQPQAGGAPRESEVVRRVERGAGSAYRLDGRDVRAKDVALLFADAATGAHSPALVSQGRIAAIVAARPAERRQMLEEAAGIAGLHVRRKDAEIRLRATEANLERLDALLGEADARAATLRRQARAAERYRALTAAIRIAEARLVFARWRDAAAAAEQAAREAAGADAEVAAADTAQRDAAAAARAAVTALAEARRDAQAARETAALAANALAALLVERAALDRRVADLGRQIAALGADRAREAALREDAAAALGRLGEEAARLDAVIAAGAARMPRLEEARGAVERAAGDAERGLGTAMTEAAQAQADARAAANTLSAVRARHGRASGEAERLERERRAGGGEAPLVAALADAARARDVAADATRDALAAIAAAEDMRDTAERRRGAAEAAASATAATLAALVAERGALARPSVTDGTRALDRIRVAPGYERALGAALGDDLAASLDDAASPRAWLGADGSGDPPLAGALAAHVEAPAAMARRLAQIVVVDVDDGRRLGVGQRLVTRDGRLRRWDGFVASGDGGAAAERLIRDNRLAALDALLPSAEQAAARTGAERRAASAALEESRVAVAAARRASTLAEERARAAAQDEDRASAALERLRARGAALDAALERARGDEQAARAELARTEASAAAVPDPTAAAARAEAARVRAETARGDLAARRAEAAGLLRALAADRARRDAVAEEAEGWRRRADAAASRGEELAVRAAESLREAEALAAAPATLDARIAAAEAEVGARERAAVAARSLEAARDVAASAAQDAAGAAAARLAAVREARAGIAARREAQELRRVELGRVSGERFECPAALLPERVGFAGAEVGEVSAASHAVERLTVDRERIGPVNLVAERELAALEEERGAAAAGRAELGEAVALLRGSIASLNREGRARLRAAFEAVDGHFRRLFGELFGGGEAHLAMTDGDDPLEAGIEIMAQPPGKKLATLTLLSGGEQALTAVALVFALFLTSPAPICVLDEVDAPLDDANVERFCDLLDAMARDTDTRFLIVTHNAVTMSRMHRLFGVTMVERGVSRLVSVDLGGAERLLAAE